MGTTPKEPIQAAGDLFIDELRERPTLRYSDIYHDDAKRQAYEAAIEAAYPYASLWSLDFAIEQLEEAGYVETRRNLGPLGDDTEDYEISLTSDGAVFLSAGLPFDFEESKDGCA